MFLKEDVEMVAAPVDRIFEPEEMSIIGLRPAQPQLEVPGRPAPILLRFKAEVEQWNRIDALS